MFVRIFLDFLRVSSKRVEVVGVEWGFVSF
jgi:hypothetical protein